MFIDCLLQSGDCGCSLHPHTAPKSIFQMGKLSPRSRRCQAPVRLQPAPSAPLCCNCCAVRSEGGYCRCPSSFYNPCHVLNAWALDSGSTGSLPNTPRAAAGLALSSEPGKYLAEKAAVTLAASLRY